jgi:hypothetical protein
MLRWLKNIPIRFGGCRACRRGHAETDRPAGCSLEDILIYFCKHYPYGSDLTELRLTKMLYLADWQHSLHYGKQVTEIAWNRRRIANGVGDIIRRACRSSDIVVSTEKSRGKSWLPLVWLKTPSDSEDVKEPVLPSEIKETLKIIIGKTKNRFWDEVTQLVNSTWPVLSQPGDSRLDLSALAREYKTITKTAFR